MRASPHQRSISAAFALLVLATAPVLADPPLDAEPKESLLATYRETVERGTAAFVARRFNEARQAFEEAFSIHPDPVLVFNIASCWRRDGHEAEALVEYRRFLTLAPSDDARRMLAEETIAALEAEPPDAPPPAARIDFAEPPPSARSIWRPIGLATTGVGAVGLIVGAVELVRSRSLASEVSTTEPSTNDGQRDGQRDGSWDRDGGGRDGGRDGDGQDPSTSANESANQSANDAKQRAILFGVSGAAVMIAGVTMYVIGKRSERAIRITASAGSDGGQVILGGRF
jgi:hypothetical protein